MQLNARSGGSSMDRILGVQLQADHQFRAKWEIYFPESVNAKGNGVLPILLTMAVSGH
jgi:hypothetical protein